MFEDFVELLVSAKTLWYQLFCVRLQNKDASQMMYALDSILRLIANSMYRKKPIMYWYGMLENLRTLVYAGFDAPSILAVETLITRTIGGQELTKAAGFNCGWDWVPLPNCIELVFKAYEDTYIAQMYGAYKSNFPKDKLPKTAHAVLYHDLSNISVIFPDRGTAESFAGAFCVKNSEIADVFC